jgi:hypothetical protein
MTGDDDSTRSRLLTLLDEIRLGETFSFVCCPELLCEVIIAYATGINDGIWRKHILQGVRGYLDEMEGRMRTYSCTASGILCGATGDIDYLVFLDDLIVTWIER